MVFDTHCHLTAGAFQDDAPRVLERAAAVGVERLVCVASDVPDAEEALRRFADGRRVWCTAGVHPHEAAGSSNGDLERVRELAADPRVVAIGECGLDYHYDPSPRDVQRRVFDAQVEIAAET